MALLRNPTAPAAETYRKVIESAARKLGLVMQTVDIRRREELEAAFATVARDRVDAIVVHSDPVLFTARARLVHWAMKHRLPGVYYFKEYVEIGGLLSYGSNIADNYRRASVYVDKILKGAKPDDLPVEQPTKFELVINLKTAKEIGIKIPQSLLIRADRVLE